MANKALLCFVVIASICLVHAVTDVVQEEPLWFSLDSVLARAHEANRPAPPVMLEEHEDTAAAAVSDPAQPEKLWFHLDDYVGQAQAEPDARLTSEPRIAPREGVSADALGGNLLEESAGAPEKVWFHLDEYMRDGAGALAPGLLEERASTTSAVAGGLSKKKKKATTVLANKNYMSVEEDKEGKGIDWKAAAKEARMIAEEQSEKKENEEIVKRHHTEKARRFKKDQRDAEREAGKKKVTEEVAKAQEQAGKVNEAKKRHLKELKTNQKSEEHAKQTGAITLERTWENYGEPYMPAEAKRWGSFCFLSGMVTGRGGLVGKTPPKCRPKGRIMFSQLQGMSNGAARVDVLQDGRIYFIAPSPNRDGFLSLDGISFEINPKEELKLRDNWVPYGGSWLFPNIKVYNGIVMLSGLIRSGRWSSLVALPDNAHPDKRLIFSGCNHEHVSRLDVLPDGRVIFAGGHHNHGWVSLDGIVFSTRTGDTPSLNAPWRPYGQAYRAPSYRRDGKLCLLSGLVRRGDYSRTQSKIFQLPSECRPGERLVFSVNNHQHTMRVDVDHEGNVIYMSGMKHQWVSLDGIRFFV